MESHELRFLNRRDKIAFTQNRLPHWNQSGTASFVTYRLADSLPSKLLNDWRLDRDAWLHAHPKPWDTTTDREYYQQFTHKVEAWLD